MGHQQSIQFVAFDILLVSSLLQGNPKAVLGGARLPGSFSWHKYNRPLPPGWGPLDSQGAPLLQLEQHYVLKECYDDSIVNKSYKVRDNRDKRENKQSDNRGGGGGNDRGGGNGRENKDHHPYNQGCGRSRDSCYIQRGLPSFPPGPPPPPKYIDIIIVCMPVNLAET